MNDINKETSQADFQWEQRTTTSKDENFREIFQKYKTIPICVGIVHASSLESRGEVRAVWILAVCWTV